VLRRIDVMGRKSYLRFCKNRLTPTKTNLGPFGKNVERLSLCGD